MSAPSSTLPNHTGIEAEARARPRSEHRPLWWTAPATLVALVAFVAPLVLVATTSFLTDQGFTKVVRPWTAENYTALFTSPALRTMAANSVLVGIETAVVITLAGLALTYWIRYRAGRLGPLVLALVIATMFASYLVRIYAWRTMLGTHGIVNSALEAVGIISGPLEFLLFNRVAVVIAEAQLYLPMMVLILYGGFRPIRPDYLEVARDLGVSGPRLWGRVVLPLMARPLASVFALSFLFSSTDWVAPQFLGGSAQIMLGLQVQHDFSETAQWAAGAALCLTMACAYAVLYGLAMLVLRWCGAKEIEWGAS
ncbi:ABC transporter permease [Streptomyces sp. B-S-A8]|uniref:ABC transporter permease n=1 Tax=Streptomyces solicavernae TaxID=3043614 RepID=A0ABT6RTR5_9ACTN|nr:ABC transporter permease [Streptomyces sp. B-S-A8]MDI3387822.1 ABC transporter permease [Streptomyces sp. B-S-A8]